MKKSFLFSRFYVLPALILILSLAACQKEKSSSTLTEAEEEQIASASAEADSESDLYFDDVFNNVIGVNDEVGMQGTGIFGGRVTGMDSMPPCVQVTVTRLNAPNPFPVRIVTDFGTAGCTGRDGHTRYGKIITVYTGRLTDPGKSATTTFENYRVDSLSIQGKHTTTNTSTPGSVPPQRQFTVTVENGKLTRPNGNYHLRNAHRVITQAEGLSTPLLPLDDVFTITGNASGTVKRGSLITNWESEITEPLRKRFTCRWISKGRNRVIRRNLPGNSPWISILDFGQGACDNQATRTVNGITYQITLH
ncbi:MAG: hypothetical protein JWP69_276 [Flaviaesturariibacter sp.]|nr:hypothetical protein [Flaviaesturariibacter sp.]